MIFCPRCKTTLVENTIDNVMRKTCPNKHCDYILWENPIPVVAALVHWNGKYLIARNANWPAKYFSLITGYLEKQELPQQAVLREVTEELGLQTEMVRFIGHYLYHEKNQLIICFEVHARGEIKLNHELAEFKLLTPKELTQYDFAPLYVTENIIRDWRALHAVDLG